jgi:hypothetical protein
MAHPVNPICLSFLKWVDDRALKLRSVIAPNSDVRPTLIRHRLGQCFAKVSTETSVMCTQDRTLVIRVLVKLAYEMLINMRTPKLQGEDISLKEQSFPDQI